MKVFQAALATGLIGQAAATWNLFGNPFNSPNYNNNECSDKQKGGFDWSDLQNGESNFSYGDFDFTAGWKCSNSFGKRDVLTKRTFGSKCIKNKVSKEKPASFGCDKRKSGFSITHIDVSVEYDVDLELRYHMSDGSLCKQVAPCSSSGSTIQNTQCGGAQSVDVYLPKHDKSNTECEIGFHNIGFDCNPGKGYNPPSPPEVPSSSAPMVSPPASSAPPSSTPSCSGDECNTQSQPPATSNVAPPCDGGYCGPVSSAPATEIPTAPCYGGYGKSCEGSTVVSSTPIETPSSGVPPPYSSAPFTNSSTPASTPVGSSTVVLSTGIPQPSSPSYPPITPPDVLPKCMNTWLEVSGKCKNNADASCYCKNKDFTKQVIDCVSAWCGTDDETREALQYLIGICAEHVPENPGLVTDCPSYIPLNPTPATSTAPAGGVSTPAGEVGSTVVFSVTPAPGVPTGGATASVPAQTPAVETPCTTITYGSTTVTIPLVHFTTQTNEAGANPTEPVGLIPGTTPAQTPASTTPALYPTSGSTLATFKPTGTGAFSPTSPAEFTGAAAPFKLEAQYAVVGAVFALLAL